MQNLPLYADTSQPSLQWLGDNIKSFFGPYGASGNELGEILQRLGPHGLMALQQQKQQRDAEMGRIRNDQARMALEAQGGNAQRDIERSRLDMLAQQIGQAPMMEAAKRAHETSLEGMRQAGDYRKTINATILGAMAGKQALTPEMQSLLNDRVKALEALPQYRGVSKYDLQKYALDELMNQINRRSSLLGMWQGDRGEIEGLLPQGPPSMPPPSKAQRTRLSDLDSWFRGSSLGATTLKKINPLAYLINELIGGEEDRLSPPVLPRSDPVRWNPPPR